MERPAGLRIETFTGDAMRRHLPDLARLRATVFRSWPYLYDADPNYEVDYQGAYATSSGTGLVIASDGDDAVGVASCLPLADETLDVQAPFRASGLDPARFFYFGESVLLPQYRGRGVGVAFFDRRESHARAVSPAEFACFCAVNRPDDHPMRPDDAGSLASFWRHRGYVERPDLTCRMSWRDLGDAAKSTKTLTFWLKSLHGAKLP